jgi:hypothetical protein
VLLSAETPSPAVRGIAQSLASTYRLELENVWPNVVKGFACRGASSDIEALAADPRVSTVEQNIAGHLEPPRLAGTQYAWYQCPTCSTNQYLWSLDRLDQSTWAARDGFYNMCPEGRSVYAYVMDEGVWRDHPEFESPTRVVKNVDFSDDRANHSVNFGDDTTNGCYNPSSLHGAIHGTAVATTLAGTHVGASKAKIVSLKTISCGLTWNALNNFNALDWVASADNPYRGQPAVLNHSGFLFPWDSSFSSYSTAVSRFVDSEHVPYFAAAGNYSTDACQFSPQNIAYTNINTAGKVFVVGGTSVNGQDATDGNDYRFQQWNSDGTAAIGPESGSNGGACVSSYAPAVNIYVGINDSYYSSNYYFTMTGTSFSSPMVAGLAVRYIESQRALTNVTPTVTQVYDFLLHQASLSPGSIQLAQTAPTYWLCVNSLNGQLTSYASNPGSCPSLNNGPYQMNSATNTSGARMEFWDNGTCP